MYSIRWIFSVGLMASAAFQPALAEAINREQLLEQMKAMRPVDLVVLDQSEGAEEYTLGIFAVSGDPSDPETRRFKLWQEYADNLVIPSDDERASHKGERIASPDSFLLYTFFIFIFTLMNHELLG